MKKYLMFNGIRSDVFGIRISGGGSYAAPARRCETVSVPGRNGSLKIDEGAFDNITVQYEASIVRNFAANSAAMREWLLSPSGYCRLEDSYHPNEFRLAQYSGGIDFENFTQNLRAASFTLSFDSKPQRFLKAGEIPVSNPAKLRNPTPFPARPLLEITPSGNEGYIRVYFGESYVYTAFAIHKEKIIVDLETYNAVDETGAYIGDVVTISGDPVLRGGEETEISWEGRVGSLRITPRWWTI